MLLLTEAELDEMSGIILKKIDRDKRFDRYTDTEIVAILGVCIMQVGANVAEEYNRQEEETADENWQAS
jgi:hypothetical protein